MDVFKTSKNQKTESLRSGPIQVRGYAIFDRWEGGGGGGKRSLKIRGLDENQILVSLAQFPCTIPIDFYTFEQILQKNALAQK